MAIALVDEVVMYLSTNTELTAIERLVLLAVAQRANGDTREAWQSLAPGRRWVLAEIVGVKESGLRNATLRLRTRGLEVRVPLGKDKNGNAVYAVRGRQTTYRLPVLTIEGATPVAPYDPGKALRGGEKGATTERKGATYVAAGATSVAPFSSVLPSITSSINPRVREAKRIIIEATGAKPSEAEAIATQLLTQGARSPAAVVRSMIPTGALDDALAEIRSTAAKADLAELNRSRASMPPCEHGEAGGDVIHPTSGLPWCLDCRNQAKTQLRTENRSTA